MKRLAGTVSAAILAVLAVSAWWWWRTPGPDAQVEGANVQELTMAVPPRASTPLTRPRASARRASPTPVSHQEEALFSAIAYSGEGFVRCDLPDGVEVEHEHLNWAGSKDGVLTMGATEPFGHIELFPKKTDPPPMAMPDSASGLSFKERKASYLEFKERLQAWQVAQRTPVGLAVWSGAYHGAEGRCHVVGPDERVSVQIVAMGPDGPEAGVHILVAGTSASETDAEGRTEATVWPDVPQEAWVNSVHWSATDTVHGEPGATYVLELEPVEPVLDGPAERLAALETVTEESEAHWAMHDAPLRRALARDDLSPDARAQIEVWLSRTRDDADEMYELLDGIQDNLQAQLAP